MYICTVYIYIHTISSHILNTSTKPTSAIHHELSCSSTWFSPWLQRQQPVARLMYLSRLTQHAMQDVSTTCGAQGTVAGNGCGITRAVAKTGRAFLGRQGARQTTSPWQAARSWRKSEQNSKKHEFSHGFRHTFTLFIKNRCWGENPGQHHKDLVEVLVSS